MDKPLAPNNGVFLEALGISLAASPSFPDITTKNSAEGRLSYSICSPTSQEVEAKSWRFWGRSSAEGPAEAVFARGRSRLQQVSTAVTSLDNLLHLNSLVVSSSYGLLGSHVIQAIRSPGPVSWSSRSRQALLSRCALRPVYPAITTDQNSKRSKVRGVWISFSCTCGKSTTSTS